jgi:hypothetical protein
MASGHVNAAIFPESEGERARREHHKNGLMTDPFQAVRQRPDW